MRVGTGCTGGKLPAVEHSCGEQIHFVDIIITVSLLNLFKYFCRAQHPAVEHSCGEHSNFVAKSTLIVFL